MSKCNEPVLPGGSARIAGRRPLMMHGTGQTGLLRNGLSLTVLIACSTIPGVLYRSTVGPWEPEIPG